MNHTNPHNSLHDKLDLDCYECHAEHKPSHNLCQTCHDNTRDWFGPSLGALAMNRMKFGLLLACVVGLAPWGST